MSWRTSVVSDPVVDPSPACRMRSLCRPLELPPLLPPLDLVIVPPAPPIPRPAIILYIYWNTITCTYILHVRPKSPYSLHVHVIILLMSNATLKLVHAEMTENVRGVWSPVLYVRLHFDTFIYMYISKKVHIYLHVQLISLLPSVYMYTKQTQF